jgi:hypothetical protein
MTWTIRQVKAKKFIKCYQADYGDGRGNILRTFDTTLHNVREGMLKFDTELEAQTLLDGADKYFADLSSPGEQKLTWYRPDIVKRQQEWWAKHKPFIKVVDFDHHTEIEFSGKTTTICKPSALHSIDEYCEVCGAYNLTGTIFSLASKKNEVKICPFCIERLFDCKSPIADAYREKYPETYNEYTAKMFMKAL